jgi:hypothetical protein
MLLHTAGSQSSVPFQGAAANECLPGDSYG